jgi:hypothetical protein
VLFELVVVITLIYQDFYAATGSAARAAAPDNAPRSIAPYFTPATSAPKLPHADGFLLRWLLLEPIKQSIRSNAVFTDSYVRSAVNTEYFPDQFTVVPHEGDRAKVAGEQLSWHALDASDFNVKLFRFAYGLNKPTYSVMFWAVTVVNSPREMQNVRMAVGSNSASMWWLNGKEVVARYPRERVVQACNQLVDSARCIELRVAVAIFKQQQREGEVILLGENGHFTHILIEPHTRSMQNAAAKARNIRDLVRTQFSFLGDLEIMVLAPSNSFHRPGGRDYQR